MGTNLIYSITLCLALASATGLGLTGPSSTTIRPSTTESITPKSKRGVVGVGTNIWANYGVLQSKSSPGPTSSLTVQQSSGPNSQSSSPSLGYSSSGSSPYNTGQVQNAAQSSPYTGQSYGSIPQAQSSGQSSPFIGQNFGITSESQSSGYNGYGSPIQSSSEFGGHQYASPQSSTSVQQAQISQSGQVQNSPITTPYYGAFSSPSGSVKTSAGQLQIKSPYVQSPNGQQTVQRNHGQSPNHQNSPVHEKHSGPYVSSGFIPYQQASGYSQGPSYGIQNGPRPVFSASSQVNQNVQSPNFRTNFPGQRHLEFTSMYAPHFPSATNAIPNVQTLNNNGYSGPTVEFNGRRLPLPVLQLQSAQDFPGFGQKIQNQPLVLENPNLFQEQFDLGFLDFGKPSALQAGNPLPFLSAGTNANQPQVLPVQSSSSTLQFPQYKGASIDAFPTYNNLGRPAGPYQALKAQPQLHFTEKPAAQPVVPNHGVVNPAKPAEEIRDDVEVIKKKKPPQPDEDEDDFDEGYKTIEKEYGQSQDADDEEPRGGRYFKESEPEGDFKPSKSFPFKSYDEKFSKYSKPSSEEETEDDRPISKYRQHSSADDEDDYDGRSSAHHSDYKSPKSRRNKYDEDDEESENYERQEEADEEEDHGRRPKAYKSYGKDFEDDFESSYKKELPRNKYVHRKEVPDLDEPTSHSHKKSSYTSSNAPSRSSKSSTRGRNRYHVNHDDDSEASHISQKYRKPTKVTGTDSEGRDSNTSYRKTPKVVHEESYGYKVPEGAKKSPKEDSYVHASRLSYKAKSPKNGDKSAYENGDSYSYSAGNSWKSSKKVPEAVDSYGHATSAVTALAKPDAKSSFNAPGVNRGKFFYSKSEKLVRDLSGI